MSSSCVTASDDFQQEVLRHEIGQYAAGDLHQRKDAFEDKADLESAMQLFRR